MNGKGRGKKSDVFPASDCENKSSILRDTRNLNRTTKEPPIKNLDAEKQPLSTGITSNKNSQTTAETPNETTQSTSNEHKLDQWSSAEENQFLELIKTGKEGI